MISAEQKNHELGICIAEGSRDLLAPTLLIVLSGKSCLYTRVAVPPLTEWITYLGKLGRRADCGRRSGWQLKTAC